MVRKVKWMDEKNIKIILFIKTNWQAFLCLRANRSPSSALTSGREIGSLRSILHHSRRHATPPCLCKLVLLERVFRNNNYYFNLRRNICAVILVLPCNSSIILPLQIFCTQYCPVRFDIGHLESLPGNTYSSFFSCRARCSK